MVMTLIPHYLLGQWVGHDPDSFACRSSHYMLDDFEKQPTVSSPDHMKAVQLTKNRKFRVTAGKTILSDFGLPDVSCNVEVEWSPDSSEFFISYSDGGAIGGYHVDLYCIVGSTLRKSRVPALVAERSKTKHWCESRGNNLFFLDWTPDSKVAFLVAEVYQQEIVERNLESIEATRSDFETERLCEFLARSKLTQSRRNAAHQDGWRYPSNWPNIAITLL